jgi:hypothetical protein
LVSRPSGSYSKVVGGGEAAIERMCVVTLPDTKAVTKIAHYFHTVIYLKINVQQGTGGQVQIRAMKEITLVSHKNLKLSSLGLH